MKSKAEWERDFVMCLRGVFGDWWRVRAHNAREHRQDVWTAWREIRLFEQEPENGKMRLVTNNDEG